MVWKKYIAVFACVLLACCSAVADEGMWMINGIDKNLHRKMKECGLGLKAQEIYNPANVSQSISGAVVSLDFIGTGSIISNNGLVITNHHCAYDDVHALSTNEHNYLEDGFWAGSMSEEIPLPGKRMLLLSSIKDVTAEVESLLDSTGSRGKPMGMRKISSIIEKKYTEGTEQEAYLSSMWGGTKYYLALYDVYTDIRLVAAPPVSIAAFGGDTDNWEWPQHKCDFALYRIYTAPDGKPAKYAEKNVPLRPTRKLDICPSGIKEGDYTMVIGFPGRTSRYNSSYKTEFEKDITRPIQASVRGETMDILREWMNKDPEVRLKYSDKFFSLSNAQELFCGEILCYNRFNVVQQRRQEEEQLLREQHGELLDNLKDTYSAIAQTQKNLEYYRESIVRGCDIYAIQTRVRSLERNKKSRLDNIQSQIAQIVEGLDLRVEKDLFTHVVNVFYKNVAREFWGDYQKELALAFDENPDRIAMYLWDNSWVSSMEGIEQFLHCEDASSFIQDPIIRFYADKEFSDYSNAVQNLQTRGKLSSLGAQYTRALYNTKQQLGMSQYPDANSSMRITYGTTMGYSPCNAVWYNWQSTLDGVLEKYNPAEYDFQLKEDWRALLLEKGCGLTADFITNNDITGGNSGSAVLNSKGQVVGLAFDGNKESLASDVSFTPDYNRCVCVDIRFILFTLEHYAHMNWILDEINSK